MLTSLALVLLAACGGAAPASAVHPIHGLRHPSPSGSVTTLPKPVTAGDVTVSQVFNATQLVGDDGSALVRSNDGGRTWITVTGDTTFRHLGEHQIVFSDLLHGFAWSTDPTGSAEDLMATTDGGRSWRTVPGLTQIINVVPGRNGTVWAVTDRGSPSTGDSTTIGVWTSGDGGSTWTHASGAGTAPGHISGGDGSPNVSGLVRAGPTTGYQLTSPGAAPASTASLFETTDSGATWTNRPTPCGFSALLAADRPGDLWLLCEGSFGAGLQHVALYRARTDQQPWQLVAVSKDPFQTGQAPLGSISDIGYPKSLIATSATSAYLTSGQGLFTETSDGGAHWITAANGSDPTSSILNMTSRTTGYLWIRYPGQLWSTTDGTTWTAPQPSGAPHP